MVKLVINKNTSMGVAILSGVSLKLCCWGPLVLTGIAGISGSSIYFSWLAALRPYLLTLAFLSLSFAFYQVYGQKTKDSGCSGDCVTEKKSFFKSKLYIWIVGVFVVFTTLISYYPEIFHLAPEKQFIFADKSNIQSVKISIDGMVCTGCEENINKTVSKLDGILKINTSHKTGVSDIEFDSSKTDIKEIENIIRSKGYIVKNIKND